MKIWRPIAGLLLLLLAQQAVADQQQLARGEYLARVADCAACHTAPGGQPFAGGLKMRSPIGNIWSSNITPDAHSGIGAYRYEDFARALREGIARDGRHLYPAMPYTAFTKIDDADMRALYAYIQQRVAPVSQANRPTDIPWPLNMRWPLTIWNALFHEEGRYRPDTTRTAQWNRGAYLVQGLAHCGTCHTPRGIALQEKALDQRGSGWLTGGTLEGWHAPDLTASPRAGLGRWSAAEIARFLASGHTGHSSAFGSMVAVVEQSTQHLTGADRAAIANYLASLPAADPRRAAEEDPGTTAALIKGDLRQQGAQEYVDNCAACHRLNGKGWRDTFPALAQNPALLSDDPSSVISIVLKGGRTPITARAVTGLTMPDFGWRLSNQQVADVVTFIRHGWGNEAPAVSADQVDALRNAK
ncbi:cytochrome c [Pantoea sp. 1.19]|uniref:cytochrome c n=1 Tax=Pantoea sp. 1.19 TaxID=1925589 RepID=UPI000948A9BF|nr:cytochrome c [Pantoea sp. 1.19]